jgi:hypothetical protein
MAFSDADKAVILRKYGIPQELGTLKVFRTTSMDPNHHKPEYLLPVDDFVVIMSSPGSGYFEIAYDDPIRGENESAFAFSDTDQVYTEVTGEY